MCRPTSEARQQAVAAATAKWESAAHFVSHQRRSASPAWMNRRRPRHPPQQRCGPRHNSRHRRSSAPRCGPPSSPRAGSPPPLPAPAAGSFREARAHQEAEETRALRGFQNLRRVAQQRHPAGESWRRQVCARTGPGPPEVDEPDAEGLVATAALPDATETSSDTSVYEDSDYADFDEATTKVFGE